MVLILVVAVRRVERDSGGFIGCKALARLLDGRVRLQRERRRGGQDLEQEWQLGAVLAGELGTELLLRRLGEQLGQAPIGTGHARGRQRVRAHP